MKNLIRPRCPVCKKRFFAKRAGQRFCSLECSHTGKRRRQNNGTAFAIEDKYFPDGKLEIRKTDNGWWRSREKIALLIEAYKLDASNKEAWAWAGISKKQYEDFISVHPNFPGIKDSLSQLQSLQARTTLVAGIKSDPYLALKYLKIKKKEEFSEQININHGSEDSVEQQRKNEDFALILKRADPEIRKRYISSLRELMNDDRNRHKTDV